MSAKKASGRLTLRTHPNMVLMLRDLKLGPATIHDLADVLGVKQRILYRYIRLAREEKKIFIADWERSPGGRPVYRLRTSNGQTDAPRLPRLSFAENKRRWRAKQKGKVCTLTNCTL